MTRLPGLAIVGRNDPSHSTAVRSYSANMEVYSLAGILNGTRSIRKRVGYRERKPVVGILTGAACAKNQQPSTVLDEALDAVACGPKGREEI